MTRSKKIKNSNDEIFENEIVKQANDEISDSEGLAWPSVVCVMVASDPLDFFEQSIQSVVNSDYPDLTTLVLDLSSNEEELKERLAQIAPSAFIRKFEEKRNFASAINEAVNSIEGATYVLICHDDVVLRPGAITSMVQEAFRSNASMVGPKILDGDNPDCLLEVGGMIDRFGVPFNGIEEGEVDQEQHDGVRDVFYVSSAAMLVRADLFRALGGFDELCFPGAEDIDLSWRAHLVGARVLVQPDAAVEHHHVSDSMRDSRTSSKAVVAQHRMRAVLKNSSRTSLLWIIPLAFILHSIEGIFFLLRLDPRRSTILFKGWLWNIKHVGQLRKARKEIQKTRVVSDRDIASHQIAGSARIRRFFNSLSRSRQVKQFRLASVASIKNSREAANKFGPIYFGAFFMYMIVLRNFIFGQVESIGSFVDWPSFSNQLSAIFHGGFPTSSQAQFSSTAQRLISLCLTAVFGFNAGLAQRIFVFALIPIAVFGMHKALKSFDLSSRAVLVGSLTYGITALGIEVFELGKLFTLVTIAALPYFIDGLLHNKSRRAGLSAGVVLAFNPAALIVLAAISVVYMLLGEANGGMMKKLKTVALASLIMAVINVGYFYDLAYKIDRAALGLNKDASSFANYFINSNVSKTIGIIVAFICFVAIVISRGQKTSLLKVSVISACLLAAISMFMISYGETTFDASNVFVLALISLAVSTALCFNAFTSELTKKSFGIFHFLNAVSLIAVLVVCVLQLPLIVSGNLDMPTKSWGEQIDVTRESRVAYIGSTEVLGANPALLPGHKGLIISAEPTISTSDSLVGPSSELDADFRKIYSAVLNNKTAHAGFLLNKIGIGTIAIPTAIAPDSKVGKADDDLLKALNRQVDLIRIRDRSGMIIYQNQAITKAFKKGQISPPLNVSKELSGLNSTDNKVKESNVGPLNYLLIFTCGLGSLAILLWPRRKELMNNAYTSVKKFQSKTVEDDANKEVKKKIESQDTIDLVAEEKASSKLNKEKFKVDL